MRVSERIAAYLEVGTKRTFAGAIEWPGWCRAGRTADEAVERLVAYGPRYESALEALAFALPRRASDLDIVERLKGDATTEFGAPSIAPAADARPIDDAELARLTAILTACWAAFDRSAAAAAGVELRTGPRGGGRTLEKIVDHVIGAEESYLGVLGSRAPKHPPVASTQAWVGLRAVEIEALAAVAHGEQPPNPRGGTKRWLPRYFVRRAAWHVLDHAWEIEDRATPAT